MPSLSASNNITKKSGEKIAITMNFDAWMATGVTILTVESITSEVCSGETSDLTLTDETISGQSVIFFCDGGTDGIRYKVIITITTSSGETLIGDGTLIVEE